MGIRLILSTNFDTLLEQAMRREGVVPAVFDIHRDADLPHAGIVRKQLSLVKLHGSAYGLRFGERLQYSLDIEARNRICGYVPDDALLVVLGFSGFERRMMQAIAHIAKRPPANSASIQVLWLSPTTQSTRSPFVEAIMEDLHDQWLKDAFALETIRDANSFLSELAFCIGSSFPAFRHKYDAFMSCPMLLDRRALGNDSTSPGSLPSASDGSFPDIPSPAVVILSDPPLRHLVADQQLPTTPSSWPSSAAAALAMQDRDRDVIWVDLKAHHSVEAVIRDVLAQIRRMDPNAPQLVLPTNLSVGSSNQSARGLVKPVERMREALQRGRYLVVFDSLESFGRPQTVHHGFPMPEDVVGRHTRPLETRFEQLCDFLAMLVGFSERGSHGLRPPLYDTVVVVTVTAPSTRHGDANEKRTEPNPCIKSIERSIERFLDGLQRNDTGSTVAAPGHNRVTRRFWDRDTFERSGFTQKSHNYKAAYKWIAKEVRHYGEQEDEKHWIKLLVDAVALRDELRTARHVTEPDTKGALALLSLLCFFRRPRPLPSVRSLIDGSLIPAT